MPISIKPIIGLSLGDPAGIGPELIEKVLQFPEILSLCELRVIAVEGAPHIFTEATGFHDFISGLSIVPGIPQSKGGKIAVESFREAIAMAQRGALDAIVTAPLNKEAMRLAGYSYPGHTEILAEATQCDHVAMLFYSEPLKVILSTIHCPLAEVPKRLTRETFRNALELGIHAMKSLGIPAPRVGVAGLNPHAGEHGLFGTEEADILEPVIREFQQTGARVDGPIPPDIVFYKAARGAYDLVVAQYHDQGLIPLKLLAFESAVNITVGTPIIRTSPDHGTAYDIVGKGIANPASLIEAIRVAGRLAIKRRPIKRP